MFRPVLAWLYGVGFGAHLVGLPFDVRLVDAILGSKFRASKQGPWVLVLLQATAYFRWINAAIAAAEQEPLIINMDEASLAYYVGGGVGTVLRTQPLSSLRPADRSRLSDRRGNVTYLASICNDPSLNSKLPQILLGNTHRFSLRLLGQAKGFLPDNIILWRESSAWNNRQVMQRYIQVLCKSLEECMAERSVFLVVDMAPCHIHPDVRPMAMKTEIRMLLVPSGLTGALQPLDTHVFRDFTQCCGWQGLAVRF